MAFAKSAVLFEILCLSSYSKLQYSFLSHLLIYDILNQMYRKLEVLSLFQLVIFNKTILQNTCEVILCIQDYQVIAVLNVHENKPFAKNSIVTNLFCYVP